MAKKNVKKGPAVRPLGSPSAPHAEDRQRPVEGRLSDEKCTWTSSVRTELVPVETPNKKPRKIRHDGWTEARRKIFLSVLRETCCVIDACRVAGMSDTSAYRLRERDPEIAALWDDAVANGQRGLVAVAHQHAVVGKETVIYRNGEEVERRVAPSDSIMALLIKRGDLGGRVGARTADRVITWEEWQDGVRFDGEGNKIDESEEMAAVSKSLDRKLGDMRMKLLARRAKAEERVKAAEARAAEIEGDE